MATTGILLRPQTAVGNLFFDTGLRVAKSTANRIRREEVGAGWSASRPSMEEFQQKPLVLSRSPSHTPC